jgi:hypothetical protein
MRVMLHSCSWLNVVEVSFEIIIRQAIGRGSFENVKQLTPRLAPSSMAGTTAASRSQGQNC